jgi:hypothetical protein
MSDQPDAQPDPEQELAPERLRESAPNAGGADGLAGGLGVSSERVGRTGPGQMGTDGIRDTSVERPEGDVAPEQRPGAVEDNPDGLEPKAGYPSADPRHRED